MFARLQLQKILNFFTSPYLDYRANKKSSLLRKWPFYVERDQKKSTTYSTYGTLFMSSRWSASTSLGISGDTNLAQEVVAEKPNSFLRNVVLSPLNLINLLSSRNMTIVSALVYISILKLTLTLTLLKVLFFIDPDFLYEVYAAQHLVYLYIFYTLNLFKIWSQSKLKTLSNGSSEYRGYLTGHTLYVTPAVFPERAVLVESPSLSTAKKDQSLLSTPALYNSLSNASYYLSSLDLLASNFTVLSQREKVGLLGLTSGVTVPCGRVATSDLFLKAVNLSNKPLFLSEQQAQLPLTSLGQHTHAVKSVGWLEFWNPTLTSKLVKQATDSTQEGRWLIQNFSSTSNFYENSKLFTHSKLFIVREWAKLKQVSNYSTSRYKTKSPLKLLKAPSQLTSLYEQHFNFFETGRFFLDARFYNTAGLANYTSNLFQVRTQPAYSGTYQATSHTEAKHGFGNLTYPLVHEPYTVHTLGKDHSTHLNSLNTFVRRAKNGRAFILPTVTTTSPSTKLLSTHKHKLAKPFMATDSDLAFNEFLNTTLISSGSTNFTPRTYVNLTVTSNAKAITKPSC